MHLLPVSQSRSGGAIKRSELIQIQMEAQLHLYPCTYEELFCYSVAESQVAGAFPITSSFGALPSTNMGLVLSGTPTQPDFIDLFVKNTVEMLNDSRLTEKQEHLRQVAMKRFSLETIIPQWDEVMDG